MATTSSDRIFSLDMIARMGLQNYVQLQSKPAED
jgi:hypothetical protein